MRIDIPFEVKRGTIAIATCLIIGVLVIAFSLWVVYGPKAVAPSYQPVPTVTPQDYYYYLVNPQDYYDGKCLIVSQGAAPEAYAAHPGIKQCEFKTVAP